MWLVVGLLQLVALVDCQSKMTKQDCDNYMRHSEPQVTKVLECLIAHYNLNTLFVELHKKMDQIELKLKEALKKHQDPKTPYTKIDHVLEINEENQNCQSQQHLVQAIRRKLEWHSLVEGIDTSHFEWPLRIKTSKRISPINDKDPELELFRKDPKDSAVLDGVQCFVINSLRSSGNESNI